MIPFIAFFVSLAFCCAPTAAARNGSGAVRVTVAQDGTGDFPTIQMAVDHAPPYGDKRLLIQIRPGIYHERVIVPQDRPRVTLLGTDAQLP